MEFEIKDLTTVKNELKAIRINVRSSGKSTYMAYFMVKYVDARDMKEIIDIMWDYDLETVAKKFAKRATEMGLSEFKIIDGIGTEYYVKISIEDPRFD